MDFELEFDALGIDRLELLYCQTTPVLLRILMQLLRICEHLYHVISLHKIISKKIINISRCHHPQTLSILYLLDRNVI